MSEQQHKSTSQFALLISNAVLGAFFFGYSVSYMNPAIKTADTQFGITNDKDLINGLINAFPALGAAAGAITSGKIQHQFGLRTSFLFADLIGVAGFLFQLPLNLATLLIGRLVIGYAVGMNSSLVPQYIKEFSPESLSGPFGAMFQMTINIGCLVALIMGMFFNADGESLDYFRFVVVFPMIICALRIFFLAFAFQDNPPSYYIYRNQYKAAKAVIRNYYKRRFADQIFDELKQQIEAKQSEAQDSKTQDSASYKSRLIVGCTLQIIQQFSGINAVLIYSSGLFINITGGNNELKNWLNIAVGLVNLVFSMIAIPLLNNFGRRPLLLLGTSACTLFLGFISLFSFFLPSEDDYEVTTSAIMVIIFMFLYLAAFQLSLGPVVWIYDADVLDEKGMSIAVLCNWLGCAIVAQFFGFINNHGGMQTSFGLFFVFCLLGTIYIYFQVKETKGKNPKDIDQMFMLGKVDLDD
ncbi:unnamed protein product (macronuclear) [Paramecium tetraurelia]|uniref:Hexose transporter 1 n=1 Tax=Paramecium tetraurelia TaxID=5888 RepID=A0E7S3_PARTE|nr:uncharacterized protein GSPATT00024068001 [Paramecium tetraurelia]CAK91340.1 unnamed protein product [Paramecium tetraurelia]|eukprot:XP_001458737.1 hypothetical protein (macronuclear) [Paramecium tetraurelia strain d4-2]